MAFESSITSSIRRTIHDQLETEGAEKKGLSPTNWVLLFVILLSLVLYTAETEDEIRTGQADVFQSLNIIVLRVFCIEFILRLWAAGADEGFRGWNGLCAYVRSNWLMVLVDFIAFAPELVMILIGASPQSWMRSLRVARLFKMARYIPAYRLVADALRSCMQELLVAVSLSAVLWYVAAVLLYLAESDVQPERFGSITRSMWWSVITLTTIGYGDVYPMTIAGKVAASMIAVIGVGTVALPSGIIAGAFQAQFRQRQGQDRVG